MFPRPFRIIAQPDAIPFAKRVEKFIFEKVPHYAEKWANLNYYKHINEMVENEFPDGEPYAEIMRSTRNKEIYYICQYAKENLSSRLIKTLIGMNAIAEDGADYLVYVAPFDPFGRQDRKTKPRAPLSAALWNSLLYTSSKKILKRKIYTTPHSKSTTGMIPFHVDDCSAFPLFARYIKSKPEFDPAKFCLGAPDEGGLKRMQDANVPHMMGLEIDGVINKKRNKKGKIVETRFIGNVQGKTVVVFEDEFASGGTAFEASKLYEKNGATGVIWAAAHNKSTEEKTYEHLQESPIIELLTTDSYLSPDHKDKTNKVTILTLAEMYADAIVTNYLSLQFENEVEKKHVKLINDSGPGLERLILNKSSFVSNPDQQRLPLEF